MVCYLFYRTAVRNALKGSQEVRARDVMVNKNLFTSKGVYMKYKQSVAIFFYFLLDVHSIVTRKKIHLLDRF